MEDRQGQNTVSMSVVGREKSEEYDGIKLLEISKSRNKIQ